MPHRPKAFLLALTLLASAFLHAGAQDSGCKKPIRFRITLDPEISSKVVSGRLLVFMAESKNPTSPSFEFVRNNGWVSAMEVDHFVPGQAFEFDPDLKSYPRPFSSAAVATYQFAALLDSDHSYAYNGQNEGDWFSPVVTVENLDPSNTREIDLSLGKQTETKPQSV